ncbi:MAG: thioredoxin-dependent thiol peroxidase [Phototrophicaceae bacterium]
MPTIGELAPNFTLLNQDGVAVDLSSFRGKKVVLFAFPRADTPGCTTQACGFRDETPRLNVENVVVLGISDDPTHKLKAWQQSQSLSYDLLSDPDHTVLEAWGAWGEKSIFGKLFTGTIRSHWVIDENGILIDEQIKISPKDSVSKALKAVTKK